ncbi:Flp family type IVb pilin [Alcaligenes faecalis]|uniref:Flp family type IVb pilin n=1 Tax=Alcaligenes TaxID=507 RepID=UPI00203EC63E|nr:Flp family type IVb pilin [Alcaligenes faecalis]MCM2559293.1 Flp family type IVb pilin [Alcaligenes faecalis]MCM2622129.1 Flp family type IVb pilin [Alcaligenes faecalis]MDK7587906.1 Flp family type IVb pilin [Alcaligenes phenolicus]UUO10121.1 Flp family type IVb pilin [Alcaligenes faecalis]
MKTQLQQFWNDEDGATAIEYGLIAGLIAVAIIAALTALGADLRAMFEKVSTSVQAGTEGKTTSGG